MNALRAALALVLLAAPLAAQEDAKKPSNPCPLAKVEDGLWCGKCKKIREKEQLADGKCKDCQSEPDKVKLCVIDWIPRCGMHNQQPHLKDCCKSKFCCKHEINKSPVTFKCAGCGQASRDEAKIAHDGKEHEKRVVKSCEASGTQPHGGEPIKDPQ
jgi:hypothetical protein